MTTSTAPPPLDRVEPPLDMILSGCPVNGEEALAMGLANRLVERGEPTTDAETLARQITAHPQSCMRSDGSGISPGDGGDCRE